MDYSFLSDAELLISLKQGDNKAFETLYKRHWWKVYLTAYKKIHAKEVAEELTQNIFVSLWERRDSLEIESFERYLMRSIKYKIINYIDAVILKDRIFHNIHYSNSESILPSADSIIALKEIQEAIEKALAVLPEKTQSIFRLSRFENRTIKEIATLKNMNEKAVEYHITQSLKMMRIQLKDFIITANVILFFFIANFF